MLAALALLVATPWSANAEDGAWTAALLPAEPLTGLRDERQLQSAPALPERTKKELWLLEKTLRPDTHTMDADLAARRRDRDTARKVLAPNLEAEARLTEAMPPPGSRILPIATFYNLWNREAWPLLPGRPYKRSFQLFLRDHYTKQSIWADTRLAGILAGAALRFRSSRVEVVSGYRSPKYNLMLRKKGRQVARESQHLQGTAVDFRVRGVTTEALREFVRGLRLGGVGYYPRTRFIHADTGNVRYWSGS